MPFINRFSEYDLGIISPGLSLLPRSVPDFRHLLEEAGRMDFIGSGVIKGPSPGVTATGVEDKPVDEEDKPVDPPVDKPVDPTKPTPPTTKFGTPTLSAIKTHIHLQLIKGQKLNTQNPKLLNLERKWKDEFDILRPLRDKTGITDAEKKRITDADDLFMKDLSQISDDELRTIKTGQVQQDFNAKLQQYKDGLQIQQLKIKQLEADISLAKSNGASPAKINQMEAELQSLKVKYQANKAVGEPKPQPKSTMKQISKEYIASLKTKTQTSLNNLKGFTSRPAFANAMFGAGIIATLGTIGIALYQSLKKPMPAGEVVKTIFMTLFGRPPGPQAEMLEKQETYDNIQAGMQEANQLMKAFTIEYGGTYAPGTAKLVSKPAVEITKGIKVAQPSTWEIIPPKWTPPGDKPESSSAGQQTFSGDAYTGKFNSETVSTAAEQKRMASEKAYSAVQTGRFKKVKPNSTVNLASET